MIDRQFYTIRPAVPLSELAHQLGVELTVSGAGDDMIELPASLALALRLKLERIVSSATALLLVPIVGLNLSSK